MKDKIYIFWDNSNIFIPAQYVAKDRDGIGFQYDVRIQFDNLYKLARAGRDVVQGVCVGSVPPELERVWQRLRSTGIAVELFERGQQSGSEQGVDQCLQVHMLRILADEPEPRTAVLLTGDGAGYESGVGFHADLERMAKGGWGIEVLSWDIACNHKLRDWAKSAGVYIPLENYYESITFLEGTRRVNNLSLTRRPVAKANILGSQ